MYNLNIGIIVLLFCWAELIIINSYLYVAIFQVAQIATSGSIDHAPSLCVNRIVSQKYRDQQTCLGVDQYQEEYDQLGEIEPIRNISLQIRIYGDQKVLCLTDAHVIQILAAGHLRI